MSYPNLNENTMPKPYQCRFQVTYANGIKRVFLASSRNQLRVSLKNARVKNPSIKALKPRKLDGRAGLNKFLRKA